MDGFEKWDKEYRSQNMYAFNFDPAGLLWLKVKAVCRSKLIRQFLADNGISLASKKLREQQEELFLMLENKLDAMAILDRFLRETSHEWYETMHIDEARLKDDLYKVHHYEWGGDKNNSLDRHLVSRYVKVISGYDELASRRDEIADNAWRYVQTSWYNNWTSYLIESLFKRHGSKVVSAVGEIRGVDFFIADIPIDLKVTFFPRQYMQEKLKSKLGIKELSWLKSQARTAGIAVDGTQPEEQQIYVLSEKLSETGHREILDELNEMRKGVVMETQSDATELIKWLYSNQGEMRFGSENRLFIVLVDITDMSQSWKMKRAFTLIEPTVSRYIDGFNSHSLREIDFSFNGNRYRSLADAIFIVKE